MTTALTQETAFPPLTSPGPRPDAERPAADAANGDDSHGRQPAVGHDACERIRRRLTELRRAFDEGVRRTPVTAQKPGQHFLLLRVADEAYAYPLTYAMEVMPPPVIVPVPGVPEHISGIVNYRGEIRTVCDLRRILGLPSDSDPPGRRILVTRGLPVPTAFLVDAVDGLVEFSEDQFAPVPATVPPQRLRFLTRHTIYEQRTVFVLNPQELVPAEEAGGRK